MNTIVRKTLLVDDSDIDLFIQQRLLEVYNFSQELISFQDAEEALHWLEQAGGDGAPEIILLDLNMPDVDGFAFLERFRTLPAAIKDKSRIVIVTSSNNPDEKKRTLAAEGVIRFITKPLKKTDVEALIILLQAGSSV